MYSHDSPDEVISFDNNCLSFFSCNISFINIIVLLFLFRILSTNIMSLSRKLEHMELGIRRKHSCGLGPYKPGRPKKACSNVIKLLRDLCKKMEGFTFQKRVCRLKLKPGRKPKKGGLGGFRTAAMGAAIAMRKRTPRAPHPSPVSARRSPVRIETPRVSGCHTIRYTAEEKRALRAPGTTPGTRQTLKNKCSSFKNDMGRQCKVHVPKGLCKVA